MLFGFDSDSSLPAWGDVHAQEYERLRMLWEKCRQLEERMNQQNDQQARLTGIALDLASTVSNLTTFVVGLKHQAADLSVKVQTLTDQVAADATHAELQPAVDQVSASVGALHQLMVDQGITPAAPGAPPQDPVAAAAAAQAAATPPPDTATTATPATPAAPAAGT